MSDAWLRPLSSFSFLLLCGPDRPGLHWIGTNMQARGPCPLLGGWAHTQVHCYCITITWCALLVRVLSHYGFYVPLLEPSSLGTLLVRVLSQYPVKVRSLCVPLGSWGSAQVYCITIIWLLLGFGMQLGVVALPLFGCCSTPICR